MKQSYRWIGLAIGILSLAYFLNSAFSRFSSFPAIHWGFTAYFSFTKAVILNILVLIMGAGAWTLLLRACGETAPASKSVVIFTLSQLAKYIPGNVAHHVGRVALAGYQNYSKKIVIFTMLLEAACLVAASLVIATTWLFFQEKESIAIFAGSNIYIRIALSLVLAVAFIFFIGWIIPRLRTGRLFNKFNWLEVISPSPGILLLCLLIFAFSFFLFGIASDILARNIFNIAESRIGLLTGAFAIAWAAGFLTPGAPAGVGVREAILLKLLEPSYGVEIAVELAISLRGVTIIADGLTFLAALIAKRKVL